jgi:phage-related minor tail protein
MAIRDMTAKLGADTSSFAEGIEKVKSKLIELNKSFIQNQDAIKATNKEIKELEKEQTELQKSIKSTKETEKEQKEKLDELKKAMSESSDVTDEQRQAYDKLKQELKETQKTLETQKEQYAKATEKIKENKDQVATLKATQATLKTEMKAVTDELKDLGDSLGKSSEGFTVLKGAISNLVSDALNVAIDKFKEMAVSSEQALNSLQAKTGMSAEAVGELKDEMYDIYKAGYGDDLQDVADKLGLVVQNINESNPEKIKSITEKAIALSNTFGSDFEENLRGVNALMTSMGTTADEAFDLIATGSQNGLDKSHELTDNLAEYTQIWAQAGFSAEEMFSILQNGVDSGAYTLDKVNDVVKEIAISITDGRLSENIDSFSDKTATIFESFKNGKATQKDVFDSMINDLNESSNLADKLATASNSWSALGEDNSMKVIEALNNVNDTYKDVAGTMQEINDIQYNDAGSQIEALGRQFEVDILQPIVEDVTPNIKNIISWVSEHLPEVTSALAGLTGGFITFKAATAAGNFIAVLINSFKLLTKATETATTAQIANNAAVSANPYVAVASVILGLVGAITAGTTAMNASKSATEDATAEIEDYTQAIEDAKTAADDKEASSETEISVLEALKEHYDELRKKVNLTASEKRELDNVAADLAKSLGTTTSALKDQSGAYQDISKNIDEYIERLRAKIKLENAQDILKEAYNVRDNELTSDDVLAARKAYTDYAKEIIRSINDSNNTNGSNFLKSANRETLIEELKDSENRYITEDAGYDYGKLTRLYETWENLNGQYKEVTGTINKYEGVIKDLYGEYSNLSGETDDLTDSTSKLTSKTDNAAESVKTLSDKMSEMASKTTAVTNAEKEYKENGKLTASTLQTIIDKYPDLENEVYKYMLGLTDAKTLIKSMKNTYQDDLTSYISVITQKAGKSNTFYNELINANADFVNKAKEQYGIDLHNFKNLQDAKEAMVTETASKIQGPTEMNTGEFKPIDVEDLLKNGSVNKNSWQYKTAESIVDKFIGSAITATTSYRDFFGGSSKKSNNSNKSSKSSSSDTSAAEKAAQKAEDERIKKYELAEAAYNKLIDKRIAKIEEETAAREKAKDKAIAAIDAEIEARKRLNEDRDSQKELNEVNAQLRYSQLDELSRRELERKRQDLLNEQSEIWWQRRASDKKDSLQNGYDSYKSSSDAMVTALQKAANSAADYFDSLKEGAKTNSYIVNNNSDTRNIQIVSNALSNQQMLDKLLNAIYSK